MVLLSPGLCGQETPAPYQALNWDMAVTLPAGAYRSAKPIDLNGDFTVTTQSNTQIDGVQFYARSGVQHWELVGTVLRRVVITGKRLSSGHATDCVFEDVDFNKDDNWYSFWWSTRWRFDNCIFTKKLLRGDLPPLDYSVHASNCTFYSTNLPPVGFKENPAGYMGKNDMVFEHCRFVDCEVPQTFLACTVDCVFENCRFEPKNRVVWPATTTPIQVLAYYAGDDAPDSYTNGPFTVEFQPEPLNGGRGSTLQHTRSGTQITLTDLQLGDSYTALGTSPLRASQLAAGSAATPAPWSAALPGAASATLVPKMPVGAVLDGGDPSAFVGPWRVVVLEDGYNVDRTLRPDHIVTTGGQRVGTWALTENQLLVRFDAGAGVDAFDLPARNGTMLGKNLTGSALSLTRDDIPVPRAVRNQVIGAWNRSDITGGFHNVVSLTDDGLYSVDGKPSGHWRIYGSSLVVNYDQGGYTDRFDLPATNDTLNGANNFRNKLMLVRQTDAAPAATPDAAAAPGYFGRQ